jgi:hypothetical protein
MVQSTVRPVRRPERKPFRPGWSRWRIAPSGRRFRHRRGRTLSAYTTAAVQNNQVSITYTVCNEQADSVTGVLLTDRSSPA